MKQEHTTNCKFEHVFIAVKNGILWDGFNNNINQIAMKNLFTFQLLSENKNILSQKNVTLKQIWQAELHAMNYKIVFKTIRIAQHLEEQMKTISVNTNCIVQLQPGILQCFAFIGYWLFPEKRLQFALYSPLTFQSGNPLIIKKGRFLSSHFSQRTNLCYASKRPIVQA